MVVHANNFGFGIYHTNSIESHWNILRRECNFDNGQHSFATIADVTIFLYKKNTKFLGLEIG